MIRIVKQFYTHKFCFKSCIKCAKVFYLCLCICMDCYIEKKVEKSCFFDLCNLKAIKVFFHEDNPTELYMIIILVHG